MSAALRAFVLAGLQFWGQMSSNPRDPTLLPGEKCDCCLMNYSMHPRYVKAGLPQWVSEQVKQGYDVGYCKPCPCLFRTLARRKLNSDVCAYVRLTTEAIHGGQREWNRSDCVDSRMAGHIEKQLLGKRVLY